MTCDFCHNAQGEFTKDDTGVFILEMGMGGHPACAYRVQETLSALRKEEDPGGVKGAGLREEVTT